MPLIPNVSIKAIIWGSCGSLPSPTTSAEIREKVKAALWQARDQQFADEAALDAYLDQLPHSQRGTYRANTSCVQIDAQTEDVILCDAGTGIRDFALTLPAGEAKTYHIFVSHLHWDHIQGFPFFTPAYMKGNRIIFHTFHSETEQAIRAQMKAPCFPVPFEAMQADIEFDLQQEGASFQIGDVRVSSIKQEHPGDSWGFRFEQNGKSIIYSSDSEHGPESANADYPFIDFFRNADVLIFDGQYTLEQVKNEKRNWGHSDHSTALDLASRAQVKQLLIFHHEPGYSDAEIESIHNAALALQQQSQANTGYPSSIQLAYDGLCVEA